MEKDKKYAREGSTFTLNIVYYSIGLRLDLDGCNLHANTISVNKCNFSSLSLM